MINKILKCIQNSLIVILLILVAINTIAMARALDLIRLPIEMTDTEISKQSAYALLQSYEEFAKTSKVHESDVVREVINSFMKYIEKSQDVTEVVAAIGSFAGPLQDVITQKQEEAWKEALVEIINSDKGVKNSDTEGSIIVITTKREDLSTTLHIDDREGILGEETKESIKSNELFQQLSLLVEIEVSHGEARILTPATALEKMERLQFELEMLEDNLASIRQLAGYSQLSGEGVVIRAYDAPSGYTWDEIVHDKDIRMILNDLAYAGARGFEIGNQRIIVGTSIRCVGPVILVNHQPVSVNPVVIRAVGPADDLIKALANAKERFEIFNKRIEITEEEDITIGSYTGGR